VSSLPLPPDTPAYVHFRTGGTALSGTNIPQTIDTSQPWGASLHTPPRARQGASQAVRAGWESQSGRRGESSDSLEDPETQSQCREKGCCPFAAVLRCPQVRRRELRAAARVGRDAIPPPSRLSVPFCPCTFGRATPPARAARRGCPAGPAARSRWRPRAATPGRSRAWRRAPRRGARRRS